MTAGTILFCSHAQGHHTFVLNKEAFMGELSKTESSQDKLQTTDRQVLRLW